MCDWRPLLEPLGWRQGGGEAVPSRRGTGLGSGGAPGLAVQLEAPPRPLGRTGPRSHWGPEAAPQHSSVLTTESDAPCSGVQSWRCLWVSV